MSSGSRPTFGLSTYLLRRLELLFSFHEINDHELQLLEGLLVVSQQLIPDVDLILESATLPHLHQDRVQEVGVVRDVTGIQLRQGERKAIPVALDVVALQVDSIDFPPIRVLPVRGRLLEVLTNHE